MRGDRSMKLQLTLIMHMKAKNQMLRHPCFAFVQVARGTLSDLIAKRKPRVHPSAMKAVAEVDEIKNGDAINAGLISRVRRIQLVVIVVVSVRPRHWLPR